MKIFNLFNVNVVSIKCKFNRYELNLNLQLGRFEKKVIYAGKLHQM